MSGSANGTASMAALMRVLDLEPLEENLFRGISPDAMS